MTPLDYFAHTQLGSSLKTSEHLKGKEIAEKVDVVIVGSGPGGLVTASVLANAGLSVLILESGRFWQHKDFRRQQSFATKHLFQDRGVRIAVGNAFIPLVSGRGVGGGTLVNSGICFRAPDYVLDEWTKAQGLEYWSDRETLFSTVEKTIGVAPTRKSIGGTNTEIARRGFTKMGGVTHDYMPRNTPGCAGCGTCQTGCPVGGKASSDLNWLPQAMRKGARLFADARVENILMKDGRAIGVSGNIIDPDSLKAVNKFTIHADKVILSAGTIYTPLLLQNNNLAMSSGMVGKNLHIQPGSAVLAKFEEEVRIWSGATQGYFAYHPTETEILAETFSAPPEAFLTQTSRIGAAASDFLRDFKHIAGSGILVRDHSSGSVTSKGNKNPDIKYHLIDRDFQKFKRGIEFVAKMYFEAGAKGVRPQVYGSQFFTSWNSCQQFIRSITKVSALDLYASHPMGTCRIGENPKENVVRPQDARTHDHEGLYVMDASLLPTALGVNPQVTIMAQCLALAENIAKS